MGRDGTWRVRPCQAPLSPHHPQDHQPEDRDQGERQPCIGEPAEPDAQPRGRVLNVPLSTRPEPSGCSHRACRNWCRDWPGISLPPEHGVVVGTFAGVGQHGIGIIDALHLPLGLRAVARCVGMMLEGEGSIRCANHLIRCVLGHVQILVMCPHASKASWRRRVFAPAQTSGNSNPAAYSSWQSLFASAATSPVNWLVAGSKSSQGPAMICSAVVSMPLLARFLRNSV